MGRHSRSTYPARHALAMDATAANYVGRVGALALALGIGAAVAGGAVANADDTTHDTSAHDTSAHETSAGSGQTQSPQRTSTSEATSSTPDDSVGSANPDAPTGTTAVKPGSSTGRTAKHSTPTAGVTGSRRAASPTVTTSADDTTRDGSATSATKVRSEPAGDPEPATDRVSANGPAPVDTVVTPPPAAEAAVATATTELTGSPAVSRSDSSTHTGGTPVTPAPLVLGALQLMRREVDGATLVRPAAAVTTAQPAVAAPSPTDVAHTVYGDIGAWLLQPNGQIGNYGGVPHDGKTVLEPINVVILDPTSTSAAESAARLDAAMTRAGFPAQPIHSAGFMGIIGTTTYGQQPAGFLQAFSDNFFLLPNDHGRMFGPAPAVSGTGYVWTGAFSTEQLNPANPFTHEYVSSEIARAELARRLVASGAATVVGVVPLGNAYDDGTFTTGDHDGYAIVLQLTPGVVAVLPTGGFLGAACGFVDDLPGPVARQLATGLCVVAAQVSSAFGLRSVI